jgi:hypothetical protein
MANGSLPTTHPPVDNLVDAAETESGITGQSNRRLVASPVLSTPSRRENEVIHDFIHGDMHGQIG